MTEEVNKDAGMKTSDFRSWFGDIDMDLSVDFDDVHSLYSAIQTNANNYAGVEIQQGKSSDTVLVRMPERSETTLELSADSKDEFLSYLNSLYDLTVDGEYAFRKAMERND